MKNNIAIIILNYQTPNLVVDCLHSLEEQIEPGISVVVVDNASNDHSIEYIEKNIVSNNWQNWVRVLCSPVNGGFAAGNNFGIQSVNADAYILLNSDTIVLPGAIKGLVSALEENPEAGLIGPSILNRENQKDNSAFQFIHPFTEFLRLANTGLITRLFKRYDVIFHVNENPAEPDWIGFACVLIPQNVIDKIGLLDDGFFMYFEDVDYCHRVRDAGLKILYWPNARIIHLEGGSGDFKAKGTLQKRAPRFYYEARARYFAKHYGYHGLWLANICWVLGRMVSFGRETIGNKPAQLRENEARDIWTNIFTPLRISVIHNTNRTEQ